MRPITPRGFRDVLPAEAAEREVVSVALTRCFAGWGYAPVETPVVELVETLEVGGDLEGAAFRLFDSDGRLLALRPDMTLPIARLIASRMDPAQAPFRLRYSAPVFREHASLRGQAREFTQTGIEFVGEAGPVADAEVVALMVEALASTGLREFFVTVGTVEVLRALLTASRMDPLWCERVLDAVHARNFVELGQLASLPGVDATVARALPALVRLRGGSEAIAGCREITAGVDCSDALDDLETTWSLLESSGAGDYVQLDFSVMRSFDYYTGMVLETYAPGLGVSLGGGGRYDGVLAEYGCALPAAGFALGLERVMIALMQQGVRADVPATEYVVGAVDAADAFDAAALLRSKGAVARLSQGGLGDVMREAERLGCRYVFVDSRGERLEGQGS